MRQLAQEIIAGRRLGRGDDLSRLVSADLEELRQGADAIRKALCGGKFELCTIINGRSGRCGEDCKFCAQSCHNHTGAEEYPFLPGEVILAEGKRNEKAGVQRFSIVTAGRGRFADGGEGLFRSGANAAITGDMLTTTGTSVAGDIAMAARLGYHVGE